MIERDDAGLLRLLGEHAVEFVVIGGWAVITHGYVRFTKDVDVLVADEPKQRQAVAAAMAAAGGTRLGGEPIERGSSMPEQGWQLETDLGRIDILLEGAPPLDLASVRADAIETEMDGLTIRVAGLAHLAAFKRLANRPQDRADLAELEATLGSLPDLPGFEPGAHR